MKCSRLIVHSKLLFATVLTMQLVGALQQSHGAHLYRFVHSQTDDVLARLTLSQLPAGLANIEKLTFTPAGNVLFGFGAGLYSGTFDQLTNGPLTDDNLGSLRTGVPGTVANLTDLDPPASTTVPDTGGSVRQLNLGFFQPGSPLPTQSIRLFELPSTNVLVEGRWEAVPEPSVVVLAFVGVGGVALMRCRSI